MKIVFVLLMFLFVNNCRAQSKSYKEYCVCNYWEVYKGKENHGQKYCGGWVTIREYKNGKKDTVSWASGVGKIFIGDEYSKYEKLSERGKYIVDSLKEDGIAQLDDSYLIYESRYMKYGKKTEQLWSIRGEDIVIYQYFFWRSKNENGVRLLKEFNVKK